MNLPPNPTSGELRLTPQNPWPGLAAFTAENHEFFFGRAAEIAEIFRRVRRQMLTVLFGVSGLGKTSLLQAGLLPRLGGTPFHPILIRLDHRPDAEDLIEQLRATIGRAILAATRAGVQIPRRPEPGEDLWGYFHDKKAGWRNAQGEVVLPVLVFDQFEEIFTHESRTREMEERREHFVELLACLVENRVPDALAREMESKADLSQRYDFRQDDYRVVISLREDFLAHLESFKRRMPSVMENRMRLERMSEEQALQAVLGPGREIVEEPVAREIVAFVAGNVRDGAGVMDAGAVASPSEADPVLLSLLCEQLNRRRLERKQERITADLLTQEREGIIQGFYEQSFVGMDARVRVWVEDELLTVSGYRNRAALEDALKIGLPEAAFDQLVDRRILHREERDGVIWLELTHDLLSDPAFRSRTARAQRQQAQAAAERERELRRKAHRLQAICVILALLCVGTAGWIWQFLYNHHWPYVRYYANFTKHFGIPVGVGLLDENQVQHRSWSLKFTYQGKRGPLISMQAMDNSGRLTPYNDVSSYLDFSLSSSSRNPKHECQWVYVLDTKGRIAYELAYDRATNLVWGFDYSPAISARPAKRQAHFVGPNGLPKSQPSSKAEASTHSSANYIQFEYYADGLEKIVSYLDWFGNPQPGPHGQFSDKMEYDTNGMPARVEALDKQGHLMLDATKTAIRVDVFDPRGSGNVVESHWLDVQSRPTLTTNDYAMTRLNYDEWGNPTNCVYYDTDGKPTLCKQGYSMVTIKYDERGNRIEWAYFDTNGKPAIDRSDGTQLAKMAYDDRGNLTNCVYCGADGNPVHVKGNNYAEVRWSYDAQGNLIEWSCFDANGQPAIDRSDMKHLAKMVYDDQGNRIEWACFDTNGKPANCYRGYARETETYDGRGNLTGWACFDANGRPAIDRSEGKHMAKMVYDDRGNKIEWTCFDTNGTPANCYQGYARETDTYDGQGNLTEWACFDANGQPAIDHSDGTHMVRMVYDDRGNKIEWACFGTDGNPVRIKDDYYAKETMSYNERGNMTGISYFDESGRPVNGKDGYAKETDIYDSRGNLTEWEYFDPDGQPTTDRSDGKHMGRMAYDDRGNNIEWACFGTDGASTNSYSGYAKRTMNYDGHGNLTEESFFDASGKLINTTNGYARMTERYDDRNNLINESYFDTAGKPTNSINGYARETIRYDSQDNPVETSCLGASDKPTDNLNGYARAILHYDERGNLAEWACFDASGQPAIDRSDGKHMSRMVYDDRGNKIEWACFGTNGMPANCIGGYAKKIMNCDVQGNVIEESYLDASNKPVVTSDGYAKVTRSFDERGNLIEWACFDAQGQPATDPSDGTHKVRMVYDDWGNRIEWACFDTNGVPTNCSDGYAKKTMNYDEQGNFTGASYFDASGKPVQMSK